MMSQRSDSILGIHQMVVDESADLNPQEASPDDFAVKFSARDFVRTCRMKPDQDERVISVPLDALRGVTLRLLRQHRRQTLPRTPPTVEPPAPLPAVTRKRPNPDPTDPHALKRYSDAPKRVRRGGK